VAWTPAPCPPADSQTPLTVLARRPARRTERGRVNLADAQLAGASFYDASLPGAILTGAHLNEAASDGAELPGVILTHEQRSATLNNGLRHDTRPAMSQSSNDLLDDWLTIQADPELHAARTSDDQN
jgi:hypothetical protein